MRPIDADVLLQRAIPHGWSTPKWVSDIVIDDAPTIDAVPVVRCKECMHWDKTWTNGWSPDYHYCPMIDGVRKGDFYCADAERSEE